jgi:hypothetical protein
VEYNDAVRFAVFAVVLACSGQPRHQDKPVGSKPDAGAGSATVAADSDERSIAGVQVTVTPADAEVVIDGTSFGVASMRVIPLDPGLHQLVVRLAGYKPFRVELTVANKTEHLTVRLEPIPGERN